MIHHYPLLVLHGISQWWRVYCIVIIFAWINFVWNVLVLLLKKQKQGVWHDLMMGSLLKLNNDHRIGLVCDTGLEVSINWCPSAISSIYRQKDNLLGKEVRVGFLLTKFCNRTFRSQVYQKHIKFTSIGLQIYLRMNMMKRKNINETVASDCGWAVIGTFWR